ncbi:MAG: sigma-70 family RNA polymerase sigma factor [Jaaginema sp. PMC 1079.18]|nr:sigma-70 family RNA polymerase sigma factor [Jaaginema sp. PMC 1080.18]MEC4851256.1 sigma-70 family RNA polymerase sigma factor [Jaaginema sp. PMC 1079.18]MEC4864477.1 sigma-70 family RNA polymerase sigma factor [Jaaginema sp. PMC 1078.18]
MKLSSYFPLYKQLSKGDRAAQQNFNLAVNPKLSQSLNPEIELMSGAIASTIKSKASSRTSHTTYCPVMKPKIARSTELLAEYARNPKVAIRNQIAQLNAGLVHKIARRISFQSAEAYEDLEQIGFIGLIRAIERFNLRKGCAFSSFAVPYIRGEILNYLRDKSNIVRIPRRWQELHQRSKRVRHELSLFLNRQPSDRELAEALDVSLQEWQECKVAVQNRRLVSLDMTVSPDAEGHVTLEQTLPDLNDRDRRHWQEERWHLQSALSQLEDKTQAAIECVFLRDLSRKEAAQQIGVSTITVSRHLQKGVSQLESLLYEDAVAV